MNTWADLRGGGKGVMPPQKLASTSFRRGRVVPLEYKPFRSRSYASNPAGGACSVPAGPSAGGEGASFPLPKNPTPTVGPLSLWLVLLSSSTACIASPLTRNR